MICIVCPADKHTRIRCRAGDKCAAVLRVCRLAVEFWLRVQRDQLNWLRSFNSCFNNFGLANSNSSSATGEGLPVGVPASPPASWSTSKAACNPGPEEALPQPPL